VFDFYVLIGVFLESSSWFSSGDSKSGGVVCANCKALRRVPGTADGEPPPFMFRPVKDEDQTAVSACCMLTVCHLHDFSVIWIFLGASSYLSTRSQTFVLRKTRLID